jgi:hypothetical protein
MYNYSSNGLQIVENIVTKKINTKLRLLLLVLCASLAMLIVTRDADANVELIGFEAVAVEGGIELEWRTASELDTGEGFPVMFYVKRAASQNGFAPAVWMTDSDAIEFEDSQGNLTNSVDAIGGITGATYTVLDRDDDLVPGQTYWYLLVEIDNNSVAIPKLEDIDSATAGSQPTPTPVGEDVGQPPPTSAVTETPGLTPTPTLTPVPTSTPAPVSTATSAPATRVPPTATTAVVVPTATPAVANTNESASGTTQTDAGQDAAADNDASDSLLAVPVAAAAGQEDYPVAEPTVTPEAYDGESADQIPGAINSDDAGDGTGYDSADASVIGAEDAATQELPPPSVSSNNETSGGNRAILWVGFLAALLIFAAGVFGSIMIFTRKRADTE